MRKIQPQHLLAVDNPKRQAIAAPPDFVQLDMQEDASASLLGNLILISLRSDWQPQSGSVGGVCGGPTYKKGSVIYTNTDKFLADGAAACDFQVLFAPTERTAYEYWTATKNYLILATMDNVKSKLEFFKIHSPQDGGTTTLTPIVGDNATSTVRIRECNCNPMDPYEGSDLFWFTKSDYITPSSLYLADASLVEKHYNDDASLTTKNYNDNNENGDNDVFIIDKLKSLPPQFDDVGGPAAYSHFQGWDRDSLFHCHAQGCCFKQQKSRSSLRLWWFRSVARSTLYCRYRLGLARTWWRLCRR
jgi:prolyl oligopeptidase